MKKRKRILIITDSLAIPRLETPYEDTWIYKLKEHFHYYDILDRPARGGTTFRLVSEGGGGSDLLEYYNPNVVILQMGMAECAPRLFRKSSLEYFLVSRVMPEKIRNRYITYVKKTRGRNPLITHSTPEQFRANLINYFERALKIGTKIIVISILTPCDLLLKKSPGARKNIELFNSIYRETAEKFPNVTVFDPIDPGIDVNAYMIDEIHLNTAGLEMIYKKLKKLL